MAIKDAQSNIWEEAGVNQFQQRLLKCIEGPRTGEIIFDPRCSAPPEPKPPARRLDPFIESLYSRPFWDD